MHNDYKRQMSRSAATKALSVLLALALSVSCLCMASPSFAYAEEVEAYENEQETAQINDFVPAIEPQTDGSEDSTEDNQPSNGIIGQGFIASELSSDMAAMGMTPSGAFDSIYTQTVLCRVVYSYAYEVLHLVNAERTSRGISPLVMSPELLEAATLRAAEITLHFNHTRPDGTLCTSASGHIWSESIAAGQPTPSEVVKDWMNSATDQAQILDSQYTEIGIGCVWVNNEFGYYWVQEFGTRSTSPSAAQPGDIDTQFQVVCSSTVLPPSSAIFRLAGNTAPETSVAISRASYSFANTVVLARADDFQDAMSATGLAGVLNAPILLTDRTGLSASVRTEIARLGAEKVYVIGGTGAILLGMDTDLQAIPCVRSVERVWGNASWDTSVKCAELIRNNGGSNDKVIVAMSMNFQDALSISSFAYKYGVPIFLQTSAAYSADRTLSSEAISMIDPSGSSVIYVPGGPAAVSETSVEGIFGTHRVKRIYGNDGYDTSNVIAAYMVSENLLTSTVAVFACGAEAPRGVDALAGAALAGKNNAVMLLVNENTAIGSVNTVTLNSYLRDKAGSVGAVYLLGGPFVVPESFAVKVKGVLGW